MKITVEISDNYIDILKLPISIERILNNAIYVAEMASRSEKDQTRIDYVFQELEPIIPALSHIAYQIRNEIWNNENL